MALTGDSYLIVQWLNGRWRAHNDEYRMKIAEVHNALEEAYHDGLRPSCKWADFFSHNYREVNEEADRLARRGSEGETMRKISFSSDLRPAAIRGQWDGSSTKTAAGYGWIEEGSEGVWQATASVAQPLASGATVTKAELEGSIDLATTVLQTRSCRRNGGQRTARRLERNLRPLSPIIRA